MNETLRLFKAVVTDTKNKESPSNEVLRKTLSKGFLFTPEVIANTKDIDTLIGLVEANLLIEGELNNTLHKSWEKVRSASTFELVLDQLLHYITTYGYESIGCYSADTVYMPNEALDVPGINLDKLPLLVIKAYTREELHEKVMKLLRSGIALKESTIVDLIEICKDLKFNTGELSEIKNKEVKLRLSTELCIPLSAPEDIVRQLVFRATESALLIKDRKTIEMLKTGLDEKEVVELLSSYNLREGYDKLSSVFHRYKPLFLALKAYDGAKPIVNKLRKLAVTNHKPFVSKYLDTLTSSIQQGKELDVLKLQNELAEVPVFRRVSLANAVAFRARGPTSIVYKIRNGKSWAKEFQVKYQHAFQTVLNIIQSSIAGAIMPQVKGQKIYIPKAIKYALPTSEKQFVGPVPCGTHVFTDKELVFGVHWFNLPNYRVDFDLSLTNVNGKIGWDSAYRNQARSIMFSGDVTDAPRPKGASEMFYVQKQFASRNLVNMNYFNHTDVDTPYDIVIGQTSVGSLSNNYMLDPNNVILRLKTSTDERQSIIGYVETSTTGNKYYISNFALGNSITAGSQDYCTYAREYLAEYHNSIGDLGATLELAGAELVDDVELANIDLSPENLEVDTIINLFVPQQ